MRLFLFCVTVNGEWRGWLGGAACGRPGDDADVGGREVPAHHAGD
jgi:hypothetical protein